MIYITGVAGTGKSTLEVELSRRDAAIFDLDSQEGLCQWRSKETGQPAEYQNGLGRVWIEAHDYICDIPKLRLLLASARTKPVIALGWISNQDSFLDLFDQLFLLQADATTLINRLLHRTSNGFAQDPEELKYVLDVREAFDRFMLDAGALPIDATKPVAAMANLILR